MIYLFASALMLQTAKTGKVLESLRARVNHLQELSPSPEFLDALADMKKYKADADSISWVCLNVQNGALSVVAEGRGDFLVANSVESIKQHLSDDEVRYFLIKTNLGSEDGLLIRLIFIEWIPKKVTAIKRSKARQNLFPIKNLLAGAFLMMSAEVEDDITTEYILKRLKMELGAFKGNQ